MGAIKFPKEQVSDDGSSCVTCQISTDGWPLLELNGYYQNNNLEAFRIYDISHPGGKVVVQFIPNGLKERQCITWLDEAKASCKGTEYEK